MIIYDTRYLNVFKPVSADSSVISILNDIQGVSIVVSGTPDNAYSDVGAPYACLTSVSSGDAGVIFTFDVRIPMLWGDTVKSFSIHNGKYLSEDGSVRIAVDHDIHDYCDIQLTAPAVLLMRSIDVRLQRKLLLNGSDKIKLAKGHNVDVRFEHGTLYITGGAGLGLGRYHGSLVEASMPYYSGIKSINGLRAMREVTIKMSDLLTQEEIRSDEKA